MIPCRATKVSINLDAGLTLIRGYIDVDRVISRGLDELSMRTLDVLSDGAR